MNSGLVVKTEYIVDDSGRNFDDGRVRKKSLFLVALSKEKAKEHLKKGKALYFIYPNFLDGKYGRKLCHNSSYLENHYDIYGDFCGERASINKLTTLEAHVVDILAARSKMDCWFYLESRDDRDCIRDLESDLTISLKEGIHSLFNGLTSLDDYNLSESEKIIAKTLFERFGCNTGGT